MIELSSITNPPSSQARDRVEALHREVQAFFLDRAMYDVNDALTSILAVCDVESKEFIPKIKKYIERVNESLRSIKHYHSATQDGSISNIHLIIENILRVMEDHYKDQFTLCLNLSELKASAAVDQSRLEKLLLYILVQLIEQSSPNTNHILIELRQKDQEALLTLTKDRAFLPPSSVKDIDELAEGFGGSFQITPVGSGLEILLRIPLSFKKTESPLKIKIGKPVTTLIKKMTSMAVPRDASERGNLRLAF